MNIQTDKNIGDRFFYIYDNRIFQIEVYGIKVENFVNGRERIIKVTYTMKDSHGFGLQFDLPEGSSLFKKTMEELISSLPYKRSSND